ncbi:helix-turn-helix transcriptional regulator [Leifsonia flava]|uniref:LuxR family transcriptional regulator n=1 Tax=Orlajensenia leifsoniae TaxID=2561933 RepID=A0A4Y9QV04_9MICO|nr:helix-turn-helix transcriptional regulator [Leifsonia flava]TFV96411.1 LuxR family transcriptional regulator [Leifsonia flava]
MSAAARIDAAEGLALLRSDGLLVAPHVAGFLVRAVDGDPAALRELAFVLDARQLIGARALPDPLPVTPRIEQLHGARLDALSPADRRTLLIAAVSVVSRTGILLGASGATIDGLVHGELVGALQLVSGRFAVADPRVRALVHERASLAERTEAHAALAVTHESRADWDLAAWHRSLSALAGDPTLAPRLLALGRSALAAGDGVWALAIARETASHARGDDLVRAVALAGASALHAGHVDDAVEWLRQATASPRLTDAAASLGAYTRAVLLAEGFIPEDELLAFAANARAAADAGAEAESSRRVAESLAEAFDTAASLFAERGSRRGVTRMRRAAQETRHDAGIDRPDRTRSAAEDWADALAPRPASRASEDVPAAPAPGPDHVVGFSTRACAEAIGLARAERFGDARRVVARAVVGQASIPTPFRARADLLPAAPRASALIEAELVVVRALIDCWAGRHARAADDLREAALRLPVSLVCGGIAAALLLRLEAFRAASPGAPGVEPDPVAAAVAETAPVAGQEADRVEHRIDQAVTAWLAGDIGSAASHLLVTGSTTRTGRGAVFPLPGIDDTVVLAEAGWTHAARANLAALHGKSGGERSADANADAIMGFALHRAAAVLRAELALDDVADRSARIRRAEELSARLPSPFDRARTELALARALLETGDDHRAQLRLVAAAEHFREAGHERLGLVAAGLASRQAGRSMREEHPSPHQQKAAQAVTIPRTWAAELTARERDVAELVIRGRSNRDVADELHLAVRTVEVHLGRVYAKTGVRSRTELSYLALRSSP